MAENQLPETKLDTQLDIRLDYLAATPKIIPLLATWHHQQWGHLANASTLAQRKARLKHHLQRGAIPTTFVAWHHEQPIGSASLVANDMATLPEWIPWLANVYVLPEYRRQGIGARLVQRVAAEALDLGYPRIYLYTPDQMHFYETMGWQTSHLRHYRGADMTVMTRDLIVNPPPTVKGSLATPTQPASA
ncbi:MAG: GNAT family N-acetyltransferase [Caldilineaceae bacterium]|nr:GNAT family N-acetyltransferase [Caldilineaceae bacterium]